MGEVPEATALPEEESVIIGFDSLGEDVVRTIFGLVDDRKTLLRCLPVCKRYEKPGNWESSQKPGMWPDVRAFTQLRARGMLLNQSRVRIGPVDGVDVNRTFRSRLEMMAVGLHAE
eukprot:8366279-Pyramimonas_sp.AAC.1